MSKSRPYLQETLRCGCVIESPAYRNEWRVAERGMFCRFHIRGERLNIPSGRYATQPKDDAR